MHEFPKCKYHATAPAVVVNDAKEEAALGAGWTDKPAAAPAKPANEPESRQDEIDKQVASKRDTLDKTAPATPTHVPAPPVKGK